MGFDSIKNFPGESSSCGGGVPAHCLSRVAPNCPRKQLHEGVWPQASFQGMIWADMIQCVTIRYDLMWYDMIWYDPMWSDMIHLIHMIWCDMGFFGLKKHSKGYSSDYSDTFDPRINNEFAAAAFRFCFAFFYILCVFLFLCYVLFWFLLSLSPFFLSFFICPIAFFVPFLAHCCPFLSVSILSFCVQVWAQFGSCHPSINGGGQEQ